MGYRHGLKLESPRGWSRSLSELHMGVSVGLNSVFEAPVKSAQPSLEKADVR